jgi:predicted DNA-binding protein
MKTAKKVQTNHKLPPSMVEELRAISEETGVPQSEIVRRALRAHLDAMRSEQRRRPRGKAGAR